MTADELAKQIGARLAGDGAVELVACNGLEEAGPNEVSFLANRKYRPQLAASKAGAVILSEQDAAQITGRTVLVAKDPYFAFRQAMVALHGYRRHPFTGVSPQATVDPTAEVGEGCAIGPFVVIGPKARLGAGCVIYPHCYIGEGAMLGERCVLHPNVTVYDGCVLGNRVTLHAGCVIGQDGFGYATHGEAGQPPLHHKIPQIGNAVIEDDVEMGANCAVDRATVGSTRVGAGSKFSDGVTIGHGAAIGRHNLLVAQVGIAGSTRTGDYVVMGGQVGVAGHLTIGHRVQIAAKAGVINDIPDGTVAGGQPALPFTQTKRQVMALQKLPELIQRVKQLERRLAVSEGPERPE